MVNTISKSVRKSLGEFVIAAKSVLRPPSHLSLREWADNERILSSESSAEQGQWVTANAPYEAEIMDAISDPLVPLVAVQKGAQLGITDAAILNPIGYHIDLDPCPILVVQPTIEIAEAFSTDRLAPMLRDTPCLRDKIADARSRSSQNTLRRKAFFGGYVALAGANSPASLSGRPVRIVLLDDVDRYPLSAGTEGNPLQLAIARCSAFWNRKVVVVSSPAVAGASHIESVMATTTCEFWYLPCPACGFKQILAWERVRFSDMTHRCQSCNEHFEKYLWLAGKGEYRAHRPIDERGNKVRARGFFVSGLVNPWVEWEILRDEFIRAVRANEEGDIELLKAFNNTRLGLLHQNEGGKVKIDLYQRRDLYESEVPEGVLVLTAGVDVQDQALVADVVGWGADFENWHIDYITIPGDPHTPEPWEALDEAVYNRTFTTHDGRKMRVRRMCVDSGGHCTPEVYAYTKPRQPRCIAIRGVGGLGKPMITAVTFSKSNRCLIASLGVDTIKEEIMNRLNVTTVGGGYCHFPRSDKFDKQLNAHEPINGYDLNYFEGLQAEQRIMKSKHGFKTYVWEKRLSSRNESWDCFVYARAAVSLPHSGIKIDTMRRDLIIGDEEIQKRAKPFGARPAIVNLAEGRAPITTTPLAAERSREIAREVRSKFGVANRPIY